VTAQDYHRGIGYAVKEVGRNAWEWAIFPPESVKGYSLKKGQVIGGKVHAVEAAKREIESQNLGAEN
jgi:hypothetical protein